MIQYSKSNTVLVFDLDDTLYAEIDYVLSGIKHIANLIKEITGICILNELILYQKKYSQCDFLKFACEIAELPITVKESLLWSYRLHTPNISMSVETIDWLSICKNEYHAIAILTDGRAITQRLKLKALGLLDIPIFISEEWASIKPDKKRFLAIQDRWKNMNYIYIADNPKKDFIAPNELNWISIGLKNKYFNIHAQSLEINSKSPQYWVDELSDINFVLKFTN